ncbi:MAG: M20/M25/M40 family metallo-hydrolase [Chloroflexota bacterium]|nr:M20/M25/M40 family metallo-hydrolase [Chloroflexota bacterium]
MNFEQFDSYLEQNRQNILDNLDEFCRIASVSAEGGPAMRQAAGFTVDLCHDAGLTTNLVPQGGGPPLIIAEAGDGPRCLMIYNHYDVQPPDPLDQWHSPPFVPEIRDGTFFARGVADNKGDLLARLTAIKAFQDTSGPLPLRILYIIEGEEEMGSSHLFGFAAENGNLIGKADGCLWEYGEKSTDDRPVVNLGVKGILPVEFRVSTAATDAHSGYGGILPNAAWRLVEALGTLRASDGQITVDGFMDHVRPVTQADRALLETLPFDDKAIENSLGLHQGLLGGLSGNAALERLLMAPSCSINGMLSGYTGTGSKTVVPATAMAKLDFRLVPDLTPDLALGLLREHLDRRGFDDVEITNCQDGLIPSRTSPDALIARAVVGALRAVDQAEPLVYPSAAGSGPMHELCGIHGVPVASTGVAYYGSRVHAPDENIRLDDFFEGIKVVGRLIDVFANASD